MRNQISRRRRGVAIRSKEMANDVLLHAELAVYRDPITVLRNPMPLRFTGLISLSNFPNPLATFMLTRMSAAIRRA